MKLFLLIILMTFSFGGTVYRTPVFTVEHSTLYCWQGIDPMTIVEHKPGDLLDGDHVLHYCSYNLDTTKEKHYNYVNQDKTAATVIGSITAAITIVFLLFTFCL